MTIQTQHVLINRGQFKLNIYKKDNSNQTYIKVDYSNQTHIKDADHTNQTFIKGLSKSNKYKEDYPNQT